MQNSKLKIRLLGDMGFLRQDINARLVALGFILAMFTNQPQAQTQQEKTASNIISDVAELDAPPDKNLVEPEKKPTDSRAETVKDSKYKPVQSRNNEDSGGEDFPIDI